MAVNPLAARNSDQNTLSMSDLLRIPVGSRVSAAQSSSTFVEMIINSLTPIQIAQAFPSYYRDAIPDVSNFITKNIDAKLAAAGRGYDQTEGGSEGTARPDYTGESKTGVKSKPEPDKTKPLTALDKKKALLNYGINVDNIYDVIGEDGISENDEKVKIIKGLSDEQLLKAGLQRVTNEDGTKSFKKLSSQYDTMTDQQLRAEAKKLKVSDKTSVSVGQLTYNEKGYVDQDQLYDVLVQRFKTSELNGFIPDDGEKFGVKTGSPEEWARLALALGKQESSLHHYPGNGYRGGMYQFRSEDLARYGVQGDPADPNTQVEAMARQWEKFIPKSGGIAGRGSGPGTYGGYRGGAAYFEPLRSPDQLSKHWDSVNSTYDNYAKNEIAASENASPEDIKKALKLKEVQEYSTALTEELYSQKEQTSEHTNIKSVPTLAKGGMFDVTYSGNYTAEALMEQGISAKFAKNVADKLNTLDPAVQHRYANAIVGLYKKYGEQGYEFNIDTAYRSIEEQAALKTKGRKASPGGSWHNYRSAIDIQTYKNGKYDDGTGKSGESPYIDKVWPVVQEFGIKGGFADDAGHLIPSELTKSVPKDIRSGSATLASKLSKDYAGDIPIQSDTPIASDNTSSENLEQTSEVSTEKVPNIAAGGIVKSNLEGLYIGPKPNLSEDNVKSKTAYRLDDEGVYDVNGNLLFTKRKEENMKKLADGSLKISSFADGGIKSSEDLKIALAEGGSIYTEDDLFAAGFPKTKLTTATVERLNSLHPEVRDRYFNMLVEAQQDLLTKNKDKNSSVYKVQQVGLSQGARSAAEQELIQQTTGGSKADVGRSWHNYALAGDITLVKNGKLVKDSPYYTEELRTIGAKHGLDNLVGNDAGHFQLIGIGSLAKTEKGRGKYEFSPARQELFDAYSTGKYEAIPEKVSNVISSALEYQQQNEIATQYDESEKVPDKQSAAVQQAPSQMAQGGFINEKDNLSVVNEDGATLAKINEGEMLGGMLTEGTGMRVVSNKTRLADDIVERNSMESPAQQSAIQQPDSMPQNQKPPVMAKNKPMREDQSWREMAANDSHQRGTQIRAFRRTKFMPEGYHFNRATPSSRA